MSVVKISWSGGKDSTASVLLHLIQGDYCKVVCYVPMFDDKIPLISKDHYEFILRAKSIFELLGAEVYIISGLSYCGYVLHVSSRGKYKGKVFGFPNIHPGFCGFKRDSKLKALKNFDVGNFDYEDVGIAFDEVHRHSQLTGLKHSILCEYQVTEQEAFDICELFDLLSPIYSLRFRDGCALCPNACDDEVISWLHDYPDAIHSLLMLEDIVLEDKPFNFPRRNYKTFKELIFNE